MKFLLPLLLTTSAALAQPKDVSIQRFDESYNAATTRAVSKNIDLIVGLSFGGTAPNQASMIKIANPDTPKNNNYCLNMRTRDGLYSAKAGFAIQNYVDKTIQFELPTKHAALLNKYPEQDLATLIFEQRNCEADKSTHLVPSLNSKMPANELHIYLNTPDSRVRAQLSIDKKPLSGIEICSPFSEGARVGYTNLCKITLPKDFTVTSQVSLLLSETTSQGASTTRTFQLSLPVTKK